MNVMFNIRVDPSFFPHRNQMVLEAGDKYNFNDDGSEISLMEVTKLDEGEYTCIAKNKAGESEQELSLRVFGKVVMFYIFYIHVTV